MFLFYRGSEDQQILAEASPTVGEPLAKISVILLNLAWFGISLTMIVLTVEGQ